MAKEFKKGDFVVIKDQWGRIDDYGYVSKVNPKTIVVNYDKYDKETLHTCCDYYIELFDEKKHGESYRLTKLLEYRRDVENMTTALDRIKTIIDTFDDYITINDKLKKDLAYVINGLKKTLEDTELVYELDD